MQQKGLNKHKKNAQYYMRVLGWILVVIIPVALITRTYITTYQNSLKVSFDAEITNTSIYVDDFIHIDDLQSINLSVDWMEFRRPTKNVDGDWVGGYYTFNISYTEETTIIVSQVMVTPLLQTKWAQVRQLGTMQSISASPTEFKIDFNYEMPQRPLYFVSVEEPILYLKVSFIQHIGGNQIPHTYYIMHDLTNEYPLN